MPCYQISEAKSKIIIDLNKEYFQKCKAEKKKYFLVGIMLKLSLNNPSKTDYLLKPFFALTAAFIKSNTEFMRVLIQQPSYNKNGKVLGKFFTHRLWEEINEYEPFKFMSHAKYLHIVELLSKAVNEWFIINKDFIDDDIKQFNSILNLLEDKNPLEGMLSSFLDDISQELEYRRLIKRCPYCGQAFAFKDVKKYCSEKCAKGGANKRDYQNHYLIRRTQNTKAVKILREFYKEKGVLKK